MRRLAWLNNRVPNCQIPLSYQEGMWNDRNGRAYAWETRQSKAFLVCECGNWISKSRVEVHPFCNHCHQPWLPSERYSRCNDQWDETWNGHRDISFFNRKQRSAQHTAEEAEDGTVQDTIHNLLKQHCKELPQGLRKSLEESSKPSPKEVMVADMEPNQVASEFKAAGGSCATLDRKSSTWMRGMTSSQSSLRPCKRRGNWRKTCRKHSSRWKESLQRTKSCGRFPVIIKGRGGHPNS